jgi:pimeloyl-ACP methyl ester carboxylesterase
MKETDMKTTSIYDSPQGKGLILDAYESILEDWPIPFERILVPTSHGNTSVMVSGSDDLPALILLHGSSTNSAMWIGDVETLGKHYQILAVDIIGEPGFSDENRPNHEGDHYGIWLAEVLSHFNLMRASVMGNSLGGWMALQLAKYRPNRIDALVLLAPSGLAPARLSFVLKAIPLTLMGQWGADKLNQIVYGHETIPDEARAFGHLIMDHFTPRMGSLPTLTDQELQSLSMPVLYIGGQDDALLHTTDSADRLRKFLPQAEIHVLADTGHVLIHEQETILNFLNKCRRQKKADVE